MNKETKDIILYKSADGLSTLSVRLENEDVWLTQKQLVELYQTAKSAVSEHIKNIYIDEELLPFELFGKSEQFKWKAKEKLPPAEHSL